MKKLIIYLTILLGITLSLNAKTDIYFGNGVWNDKAGAEAGKIKLEEKLLKYFKNNPSIDIQKYLPIGLSFNWTGASSDGQLSITSQATDLLETIFQLRDSGPIDNSKLYKFVKLLVTIDNLHPLKELMNKAIEAHIVGINAGNLIKMIENYEALSLIKGHKILLVAHSQGNLFGNEVWDNLLTQEYKDNFKMVSVGTPADKVLDKEVPYTTLKCDQVINKNFLLQGGIPNHLIGKTECTGVEDTSGHKFVESYLTNINAQGEILSNIENILLKDTNTTQPPTNDICPVDYFTYYDTGTLDELLQSGDKDVGVSDGDKRQVKELQTYLEALGIDIGSSGADGWYGDDTVTAVSTYQNTNGLAQSGEIDIETQDSINNSCATDTNTSNPDSNSTTGGTDFDFSTACSISDLPDPVPSELTTSINTIIENAGTGIVADVVCPLIQGVVTAYNLANGGGLPGGIELQ